MLVDDLPSRLMESCVSGRPWPAQLERVLARTRPGQLLRLFRQLKVRGQVFCPEGLPRLEDLANRSRPGRRRAPGKGPVTLPRLLYLLRAQWDHLLGEISPGARDRLDHVWQVQLCPTTLRKRMARFLGVTFLPGRRLEAFPDGEELTELHHLNVLSLGFRRHQPREGEAELDMLDVKVHGVRVDPESGQASLVPRYARHFNYAPFPGAD